MEPAQEYPHLRQFVRGYLHQDAALEYGSAAGAMRQFCTDADAGEQEQLRDELRRFAAQHTALEAINNELQRLGCAWLFRSKEEFEAMIDSCKQQD